MAQDYEPVILGLKFALRVRDLRPEHRIKVECGVCGHVGYIDPCPVLNKHPPHRRLVDIERSLKCAKCGNRNMNFWSTVRKA